MQGLDPLFFEVEVAAVNHQKKKQERSSFTQGLGIASSSSRRPHAHTHSATTQRCRAQATRHTTYHTRSVYAHDILPTPQHARSVPTHDILPHHSMRVVCKLIRLIIRPTNLLPTLLPVATLFQKPQSLPLCGLYTRRKLGKHAQSVCTGAAEFLLLHGRTVRNSEDETKALTCSR